MAILCGHERAVKEKLNAGAKLDEENIVSNTANSSTHVEYEANTRLYRRADRECRT